VPAPRVSNIGNQLGAKTALGKAIQRSALRLAPSMRLRPAAAKNCSIPVAAMLLGQPRGGQLDDLRALGNKGLAEC
jgi:hypothetical protein